MLLTSIFPFSHCFQKAFLSGLLKVRIVWKKIYSLPHSTSLDLSKLKAFADDNFKVVQMVHFYFDRVENMVGKGENAGYQHFLLFPLCFQKASFFRVMKSGDCMVKGLAIYDRFLFI